MPQNPADIPSVLREIGGNAEELSWSVLLLAGGVAGLGLFAIWTVGHVTKDPFCILFSRLVSHFPV